MNVEILVLYSVAAAVFFSSVLAAILGERKADFLWLEDCRLWQESQEIIITKIKYNPFEIVKHVAFQSGVSPSELIILSDTRYKASVIRVGGEFVVVCGMSFLGDISREEFEGVVGHEIGHISQWWWRSFLRRVTGGLFCCLVFFVVADALYILSSFLLINYSLKNTFSSEVSLGMFRAFLLTLVSFAVYLVFVGADEFAADKKALFTRYPQDYVNLLSRLAEEEKSSRNSGDLVFTYPPLQKRVKAAQRILRKRGVR